jgi:hypothetical protein
MKRPQVKAQASVRKTDRKGCMAVLFTLLAVVVVIIVASVIDRIDWSPNKKKQATEVTFDTYLEQWAGYYEIIVNGYSGTDKEKLALRSDGTATWVWVQLDDQGKEVEMSRKYGNWSASANKITTTFALSSGYEDVEYVYDYGVFKEEGNKSRYLRRYKQ